MRAHGFPSTKRLSPVVVVFNPGRARRGCKEAWPSSCRRWISVLPFQEECHIATWLWFPTNLRGPGGGGGGRGQAGAPSPASSVAASGGVSQRRWRWRQRQRGRSSFSLRGLLRVPGLGVQQESPLERCGSVGGGAAAHPHVRAATGVGIATRQGEVPSLASSLVSRHPKCCWRHSQRCPAPFPPRRRPVARRRILEYHEELLLQPAPGIQD